MRRFSFYHRETGAVHPQRFSTDAGPNTMQALLAANTPADHVAIEAELDHVSQRVNIETGAVEDWQPPQPSPAHEWDTQTRRWTLNAKVQAEAERRRTALAEIARLEASQGRALRESALGQAGAVERLAALDAQITALRARIPPPR